jgi:hypothetical protein
LLSCTVKTIKNYYSKAMNNLVLKMGANDQITCNNWYGATPSKSVVDLQVLVEAISDFSAGGINSLLDHKVENFNFSGLVRAFDSARGGESSAEHLASIQCDGNLPVGRGG